jgi:hypothetical protein
MQSHWITAMALSGKVKTALDEARTLILGAQILLGFQFQGVFQERFNALPPTHQSMSAVALMLMLLAIGLLIAPTALHRIAEQGYSTGRIKLLTGRCAAAALLPFAAALGLDLTLISNQIFSNFAIGAMAGGLLALMAAAGWYGVGIYMKRHHGFAERRNAEAERGHQEKGPLHARIEQMLTEARVILPGAQALFGFQLVIVLTSTFDKLPDQSRIIHGFSLLCVALSVILLITPAALHRIVWAGEDTEALLQKGGYITIASLLPLALGIAGDTYVVLARVFESERVGALAALVVALFLAGLWFVWPIFARRSRGTAVDEDIPVGCRAGPQEATRQ